MSSSRLLVPSPHASPYGSWITKRDVIEMSSTTCSQLGPFDCARLFSLAVTSGTARGPSGTTGCTARSTSTMRGWPARWATSDTGRGSRYGMVGARADRPAAVDVRHRPDHRPRQRRATTGGRTRPGCVDGELDRACSTAPTSSWCGSSAATAPGRTASTRWSPAGVPTVVLSGEQAPDAELMEPSTVPAGRRRCRRTSTWPRAAPRTCAQLHAFLSDTVLMTGYGFEPPVGHADLGCAASAAATDARDGPTIAVLYYRAQQLAGNTGFVEALCDAIEDAGGRPLPVFCASLRTAEPELLRPAGTGRRHGHHRAGRRRQPGPRPSSAGGDDDSWDVGAPRRAGHPDPAGAVPDQPARAVGRPTTTGCQPAGRRHPGRGARSSTAGSSRSRSRSRRSTTTA